MSRVRVYDNKVRKLGTNGGERCEYEDDEMQESTTVKNGSVPSVWIVLHGVATVTHRFYPHTS